MTVLSQHNLRTTIGLIHQVTHLFVDRSGGVLTRAGVEAWLERVTGGVLIARGARLAWERR